MGSHIASIGIHSREELEQYMKVGLESAARTEHVDAEAGRSYWLPDNSAGLCIHVDAACFVPAHQSTSLITLRPVEWINDEDNCTYCDMLGVEVLNRDETMLYPLALTFGNMAKARKEIALGDTMELAVTAFVETGKSWENVAAFEAGKEADDFIGIGWFFPFRPYSALDSQRTSSPRAGFYNVVNAIEQQTNSVTGNHYRTALLQCGSHQYYSVIADDTLSELAVGNVVYVECWMCVAN